MKYSVSATCLDQNEFEGNVRALLRFPVTDLHCDYFPEIETKGSLSLEQIEWCQRHWPHGITFHVWGMDGIRGLAELARRGRLLVQLHSALAAETQAASYAAKTGWQTGVSLIPELVRPVVRCLDVTPVAVQVLATSTPGFIGGSLLPATWRTVDYLHQLRAKRRAGWAIEVDGGLTETAVSRLHNRCDLAVLGSNYLRVQLETGYRLPLPLLEEN